MLFGGDNYVIDEIRDEVDETAALGDHLPPILSKTTDAFHGFFRNDRAFKENCPTDQRQEDLRFDQEGGLFQSKELSKVELDLIGLYDVYHGCCIVVGPVTLAGEQVVFYDDFSGYNTEGELERVWCLFNDNRGLQLIKEDSCTVRMTHST
ncbi:MAG: hypothetical protein PHV61_04925 [Limnochordia bacterium]|jgi:hypothetical protein|nr:hypothetical protein [Limnochordia bacterium]MDD2629497.1 hypothetical protein [Limnochordia bacterium]MDD4518572.1 hypothetical protein [Limnochordia bacterium]